MKPIVLFNKYKDIFTYFDAPGWLDSYTKGRN